MTQETGIRISDLSRGGCRLVIDVKSKNGLRQTIKGDDLILQASLSAEGAPLSATCTVCSVEAGFNRLLPGISFTDMGAMFRDALDAFLSSSDLLSSGFDSI